MAYSLGIKNTCLPSKSYLSSRNTFQLMRHSSYLLNGLNCRNSSSVFPVFMNKLDDKRSFSVQKIRCVSGSSAAEIQDSIKAQVSQNPVVVYSKSWCPYCQEAKGLFQELGVKPFVVELDELGNGERNIQDALKALTGQSTVPNIFIGGKHIGGCSDTMELHQNGELASLLSAAGVNVA